MAKFIGKWKGESSAFKNYDNFSKASGMPDEMIEKLRNSTIYVEFKQDGDVWTLDFGSNVGPDKSYKFKSGEEVTTTDPWGKGLKFTFTIDSDEKITQVEQSESMGWKTFTVIKVMQGDDKFSEAFAILVPNILPQLYLANFPVLLVLNALQFRTLFGLLTAIDSNVTPILVFMVCLWHTGYAYPHNAHGLDPFEYNPIPSLSTQSVYLFAQISEFVDGYVQFYW